MVVVLRKEHSDVEFRNNNQRAVHRVPCPCEPHVPLQDRFAQGGAGHSPYTKGNFQLEQVVTGWRAKYSVLDLRLKK
jgi:hypothetical protein